VTAVTATEAGSGEDIGRGGRQIHKMLPSAFLGIRLAALPEVPEARRVKPRCRNRVLDLLVPRQCCSAPRVMPLIGEFRPAGVAEHVRMNATEADHSNPNGRAA
jgi:hypothetical protein